MPCCSKWTTTPNGGMFPIAVGQMYVSNVSCLIIVKTFMIQFGNFG